MTQTKELGDEDIIKRLNSAWPPCVEMIGGHADAFDQTSRSLVMSFQAIPGFCHSGDIVQGGYITAMLDAAMAFSVMGLPGECNTVATLEIKVNFLLPGRIGKLTSFGKVVHLGRSIGYLEATLSQNEKLIATSTSTVKLIRGV
jgi:uncharacterized protein (TIGR00369 family)